MNHWLVKQEPEDYGWSRFAQDRRTAWTGVRNFQARKNLDGMQPGDRVLFYESGKAKKVVGIATVAKRAYPDPTAKAGGWLCVDLKALRPLAVPVDLAVVKGDKLLQSTALVKQSRLSVMPLSAAQFDRILELGGTKLT